jgi:hypothetical protein
MRNKQLFHPNLSGVRSAGSFPAACLLAVCLMSVSCQKDLLNKQPLDQYSDANVWKDSALITRYLDDIYSNMITPYDYVGYSSFINQGILPADLTDEAKSNFQGSEADLVNAGQYNAATGIFDVFWSSPSSYFRQNGVYENVRKCNLFISYLPTMPLSVPTKAQLDGEVHLLRAYNYQFLYSIFGRFPIIQKPLGINDDLNVQRGSDDSCVAFMLSDLDTAAALLPVQYNDPSSLGRATKGAALGLKCRLLLNKQRYSEAAAAAQAVMALNVYSLFPDYEGIFYPTNDDNQEVVFNKEYGSDQSQQTHNLDNYENSSFFTGFGSPEDVPTQNIVDQYLMTDGLSYDLSPLYDPAHPYANRDPRLQASIIYDGTTWMGQTIDMQKGSAYNSATISPSITGYMLRKFLNPTYSFFGNNPNYQNCIILRLAEIYLDYAECELKLNNPEEARTYINLLRERVGMPDVPSGQMNWATYMRERTVELAFEGERWNDIRRWDMGPQLIGAAIYGMNISTTGGVRQYNRVQVEQRVFDPKMYYFPIPQAELLKYPSGQVLEQNPGW